MFQSSLPIFTSLIVFLLLFSSAHSQEHYSLRQIFAGKPQTLAISSKNSFTIINDPHSSSQFYKKDKFTLNYQKQPIQKIQSIFSSFTNTQKQMVLCTENGNMIILDFIKETEKYEEISRFSDAKGNVVACDITDTGYAVYHDEKTVFIYKNHEILFQKIMIEDHEICFVDISDDNSLLAVTTTTNKVFFYRFNSIEFKIWKEITLQTTDNYRKQVWLLENQNSVVVPDKNPRNHSQMWIKIYTYDQNTQNYEESSKAIYTQDSGFVYLSASYDMKKIVLTGEKNTYIVSGLNQGSQNIISTIPSQKHLTNTISRNGQQVLIGTEENALLYKKDDLFIQGRILQTNTTNQTNQTNFTCNLTGCEVCLNETVCQTCMKNYYLNSSECYQCLIPVCLDCSNPDYCIDCDETMHYYSDEGNCTFCNFTNDTFVIGETCEQCAIEGCIDCESLDTCITCNQSYDYFKSGQVCAQCSIDGCLDCESLTSCVVCDEANGYSLNTLNGDCFIFWHMIVTLIIAGAFIVVFIAFVCKKHRQVVKQTSTYNFSENMENIYAKDSQKHLDEDKN